MTTTGTRLYFTLGFLGLLAAAIYGIITNGVDHGGVIALLTGPGAVDALLGPITLGYKGGVGDHIGYAVLIGFAMSNIGLGAACAVFRDSDPLSLAELEGSTEAPRIASAPAVSIWPMALALAGTLMMVGLVTSVVWVIAGAVLAVVAGAEWTIAVWAETATGDPAVNRTVRNRLMLPIELPVGALLLVAAVVFCVSRILLTLGGDGAVILGVLLAAAVFGGALVLNSRPHLGRPLGVAVAIVAVVGILAMGIIGAALGEKEHEGAGSAEHSAALVNHAGSSVVVGLGEI